MDKQLLMTDGEKLHLQHLILYVKMSSISLRNILLKSSLWLRLSLWLALRLIC